MKTLLQKKTIIHKRRLDLFNYDAFWWSKKIILVRHSFTGELKKDIPGIQIQVVYISAAAECFQSLFSLIIVQIHTAFGCDHHGLSSPCTYLLGIVRKELNQYLEEDDTGKPHYHTYVANIVQLAKMLREYGLQRYIRSGNRNAINRLLNLIYKMRHKIKVSVRANRHHKRWERLVTTNSPTRYRVDGRNWPKVATQNCQLRTVQP